MAKWTVLDDNEEKIRWFKIDEDSEIQIKYVTRQDLRKINSKSSKASRLAKEDMSDYFNCLLGRAAVLGWRKVDNHDHPGLIVKGRPFPFSQDNLDILMTKSLDFSKFVNDVCVDAEMFDLEDEDTIKND